MKFDKLLANFLYETKYLPLNSLGEVFLDDKFVKPENNTNTTFYPQEGINFKFDRNVVSSEQLINYLKTNIAKPASLIESDLEDYFIEIRNWLNIGKSISIEGIGTFSKLSNGDISFEKGFAKTENISDIIESAGKKYTDYSSIVFNKGVKNKALIKRLTTGLLVLGLLITAWVLYPIIEKNLRKENISNPQKNITTPTIVEPVVVSKPDTIVTTQKKDSVVNSIPKTDSVRYKMYFLTSKFKDKADKAYTAWSKYTKLNRDSLMIRDTIRYRLFVYRKALPKDTPTIKKQLEAYFGHSITIAQ